MGYQLYDFVQLGRLRMGIRERHLRKQKSKQGFNDSQSRVLTLALKIFKGNSDAFQLRHSYLEHPIRARFVRVHVVGWIGHPSMRLEIVGCQECNEVISGLPFTELSASSYKRWSRKKNYKSCLPDMGDIASTKGWCPRRQNKRQWLQFDLGPPTAITGLVTRGQGDKKRYVTSYTMSYSNDSTAWTFYSEANDVEARVFGGNMDTFTERRHYLNEPVIARFVRIHPTTWHKRIGLRAAVLGCPHTGECGPGFMRVNEGAPCVANKAYKGLTWINDGSKSDSEEFRYGHSSFAVNGEPNADLSDCAIMDNFYADEPVWAVDLGAEQSVNGAVVVTWQGAGQDKITAYTDYVHSLDKLTVYVTTKRTKSADLNGESKCAAVSRMNNALFNPRVHFECPVVKRGRFVYVKASGVSDRWRKSFTVVLCQVQVY